MEVISTMSTLLGIGVLLGLVAGGVVIGYQSVMYFVDMLATGLAYAAIKITNKFKK